MNPSLKKTIRYLSMFLFSGFLLWIAFDKIEIREEETKMGFIGKMFDAANKYFITLSVIAALLSHYFRAKRWKLLLKPIGYPLKSSHSLLSVMVGYFVNLGIPRGGELSRCYNLYKLNRTPIDVSFGTVVCERIIDLFFLLLLIGCVILIELDVFLRFFSHLNWTQSTNLYSSFLPLVVLLIIAISVGLFVFYKKKKRLFLIATIKVKFFLVGIKSGILSISKLEKRGLFILYSLLIWACYYLMNYFAMEAFSAIAELPFFATLTIFVTGGIALAMPLPGGIGSYHFLVSKMLVLYGVAYYHAIAFSTIVHTLQTLLIIGAGVVSLILSQLYYKTQQK